MRSIADIVAAHVSGTSSPSRTIAETYAAIRAHADPALFISLKTEDAALAEAAALEAAGAAGKRLYGVPIAVKDNIDVEGLPTTAACPAFTYMPTASATAVQRLVAAGAIVIGKTNLDQFATGLVGVRSPYGVPRNAVRADLVPGGSSSGSASIVSAGIVPIALGTDTAGSGRVPAGLQNIVGLKPSLGLVPTKGVVPACRTLDCVSVFATTVDDAWQALDVMAGFDVDDPFSRQMTLPTLQKLPAGFTIGLPRAQDREFAGDGLAEAAFDLAIERLHGMGIATREIDLSPFLATARLLYEGPWVAERYLAVKDLLERDAAAIHPVTREIIAGKPLPSSADAFAARYRLAELARAAQLAMQGIDAIMAPTAPTAYTVEQVLADPIRLNSVLGTYTNFVNLLDLSGLAVPVTIRSDGIPSGVTFLARAGADAMLASLGRDFHAASGLMLGASQFKVPAPAPLAAAATDEIELAVVGAHMSGMALNSEMTGLGARLVRAAQTSNDYRLYALPGGPPQRPGLLRVAPGAGAAIAIEIWALPPAGFARFVSAIPAPLGIGTLHLSDGGSVKGFLVEAEAVSEAEDITGFGGWRAYVGREIADKEALASAAG